MQRRVNNFESHSPQRSQSSMHASPLSEAPIDGNSRVFVPNGGRTLQRTGTSTQRSSQYGLVSNAPSLNPNNLYGMSALAVQGGELANQSQTLKRYKSSDIRGLTLAQQQKRSAALTDAVPKQMMWGLEQFGPAPGARKMMNK